MSEARMPTTLPSPVDRGHFRFVAVDAAGAVWRWIDDEMVWVRQAGPKAEGGEDVETRSCTRRSRPGPGERPGPNADRGTVDGSAMEALAVACGC